jgi:hypothetical protein
VFEFCAFFLFQIDPDWRLFFLGGIFKIKHLATHRLKRERVLGKVSTDVEEEEANDRLCVWLSPARPPAPTRTVYRVPTPWDARNAVERNRFPALFSAVNCHQQAIGFCDLISSSVIYRCSTCWRNTPWLTSLATEHTIGDDFFPPVNNFPTKLLAMEHARSNFLKEKKRRWDK